MRHVALTVAGWWLTWVLFGLVAYFGSVALICLAFRWLHSRDVAAGKAAAADEQPVPYWPPETNPCTWCKPRPDGRCSCTAKCGHIRCVAPRRLWTAADREILEGKRLP